MNLFPGKAKKTQPDPFWGIHNMTDSPLAILQAANLYVYTMNNPVRWVDPSGLNARNAIENLDPTTQDLLLRFLVTEYGISSGSNLRGALTAVNSQDFSVSHNQSPVQLWNPLIITGRSSRVTSATNRSSSTMVSNNDGTHSATTTIRAPLRGSVDVTWWVQEGFIQFDFPNNNYWGVVLRDGVEALAREMITATRNINPNYLSGRTVGGMMADLELHHAAYVVDVFDLTHRDFVARIGGTNRNMPGYDDNAWFFEAYYRFGYEIPSIMNPFIPSRRYR